MEVKIKLKIKDVEIELTKEQAKELHEILAGMVGQKTTFIPYQTPIAIEKEVWPWKRWEPYWISHTGTTNSDPRQYQTLCLSIN